MIVSRRPEGLVLVRQVDHQAQCAAMAEVWGNADFARPPDWGQIVAAADCHDEGWRVEDERPTINRRGAPTDFPDIDRARHVGLYSRGIERAEAQHPLIGLLVSMHGVGLYRQRLGLDGPETGEHGSAVAAFLATEDARQERLRATLGDDLDLALWTWDAYRLLQAFDSLSLYLVWRGLGSGVLGVLPQVPRWLGDPGVDIVCESLGRFTASCDPFPFAGDEVELPIEARAVPDRSYRDDDDLQRAFADAPTVTLECVVCRRPGAASR